MVNAVNFENIYLADPGLLVAKSIDLSTLYRLMQVSKACFHRSTSLFKAFQTSAIFLSHSSSPDGWRLPHMTWLKEQASFVKFFRTLYSSNKDYYNSLSVTAYGNEDLLIRNKKGNTYTYNLRSCTWQLVHDCLSLNVIVDPQTKDLLCYASHFVFFRNMENSFFIANRSIEEAIFTLGCLVLRVQPRESDEIGREPVSKIPYTIPNFPPHFYVVDHVEKMLPTPKGMVFIKSVMGASLIEFWELDPAKSNFFLKGMRFSSQNAAKRIWSYRELLLLHRRKHKILNILDTTTHQVSRSLALEKEVKQMYLFDTYLLGIGKDKCTLSIWHLSDLECLTTSSWPSKYTLSFESSFSLLGALHHNQVLLALHAPALLIPLDCQSGQQLGQLSLGSQSKK